MERLLPGLDRLLARGAVPARLERRAACIVPGRIGLPGMPRAPTCEQPQRTSQLAAGRRQLVNEPRRALRVRLRHHDPLLLEMPQPRGEDVRRDALGLLLEVVESP